MSRFAPLNWRKASSSEATYTLPAISARPGLPITRPSAQSTLHSSDKKDRPTTKPKYFPPLSDVGKYQPPISEERTPISPLLFASPTPPRRPTRQAATRAKERFSEVYAPLIIEEDAEFERTTPSSIGAPFSRTPNTLSWFSDSSDDDEYVDDGDDEGDRKRSRRSRARAAKGNKRPRTGDVEKYYARLDHEKMTIAAGKAGTRKRTKLAKERKARSETGPVQEREVGNNVGIVQDSRDSVGCELRWSEATLVDREDCAAWTKDIVDYGGSEHERPVSDVTLVGV